MRKLPSLLAGILALLPVPALAQETGELPVDVELVLAVDVSWSMDLSEQEIQRGGYAAAFRSDEVQRVILEGGWGRVAVTFVEWAGEGSQAVVVPWMLIDSEEAAATFADRLEEVGPRRFRRTSIAAAIDFAVPLFENNGYEGLRKVIDISGDGPNNQGRPVTQARDAAAERGITVNGLPLMTSDDDIYARSWGAIEDLDRYYAECVIGGPAAFMIPVNDWEQFPAAVRRKLVLELAGRPGGIPAPSYPNVVRPAQSGPDCLIGERLWRERQEAWP